MSRPGRGALLLGALAMLTMTLAACSPSEVEVNPALTVARLDEIPPGGALRNNNFRLFLVDTADEGVIALSDRDPFLGCRIVYLADQSEDDRESMATHEDAEFFDPCHGSEYDINGGYLSGPSEESMRRISIKVIGRFVVMDANPAQET